VHHLACIVSRSLQSGHEGQPPSTASAIIGAVCLLCVHVKHVQMVMTHEHSVTAKQASPELSPYRMSIALRSDGICVILSCLFLSKS